METNNRLALWMNAKREKQTQPHLSGQGEVNNDHLWVSAWFSQDITEADRVLLSQILSRYQSKKPFISISVQPKVQQEQAAPQERGANEPPPF